MSSEEQTRLGRGTEGDERGLVATNALTAGGLQGKARPQIDRCRMFSSAQANPRLQQQHHDQPGAAVQSAHQHVAGRQLVVVQEGLVLLVDLAAHLSIVRLGGRSGGHGGEGSRGPADAGRNAGQRLMFKSNRKAPNGCMWHQAGLQHELGTLTSLPAQLEQAPARQEKGRSRPAPQGEPAQPGVSCKACRASGASTLKRRAG